MSAADQRNAFDALKEALPVDLVPGFSVVTPGVEELVPASPWTQKMKRFSDDLAVNAHAYYNFTARRKGPLKRTLRTPKKVISPEGFPPWVNVTYTYPPAQAFYTMSENRSVQYFIFHSFGHAWHATVRDGKSIGWMNSTRGGRGVQAYEFDNRTVYVAKGSDPETLAHFTRFSAGLRACLHSAAKATAHFFIDRGGNLVVIGDCNDVMFTSNQLNKKGIGVELEEAFYVLHDTKGKGNKAVWRPGGNPPGTAGNIEYFAYSPQQLFTLSILCKKLETVFPKLKERNVYFNRRNFKKTDPPGYTMHDFIKGSTHLDVSPQFLTQDLWDRFFSLVDTHTHITPHNVFYSNTRRPEDTAQAQSGAPLSTDQLESMTERLFAGAKEQGLAFDRSQFLAERTRREANQTVAKSATKRAKSVSQQVADMHAVTQKTQNPMIDSPSLTQSVDAEGNQVGSDAFW
jgi:hypothetical protein